MIRLIIPSILLFSLPFAVYYLWLKLEQRRHPEATWAVTNLLWAAVVGAALSLGGFVFFVDPTGAPPDSIYVPPRYEDGVLIPGHFEPHHKAK